MSGARRAAGGESGPRGRGKHRAPRSGPSGETPPSARTEPSSAARARPVLQRRRERPGERLAWWGRGRRGLDPRANFPGASAGGGCGSQLRPLADPGPGASASGWEGLEPQLRAGGIVTSLGERKLASFPESGKRIADGGPGGTLERWRPSMFYTRKQDQS
ncbi:hypothetical protein R6Z07F_007476 [Ovis aries]